MLLTQAAHVTGLELTARWHALQMRRHKARLDKHRASLNRHHRELVAIDARARELNTAVNG